jgi:hypothetical protein
MTDENERRIRRLLQQVAAQEPKADELQNITKSPVPIAAARFQLTQLVLWAFLVCIAVTVIAILCDYDNQRVVLMIDLLKTMLLPLVTLMIGHYFGSKGD